MPKNTLDYLDYVRPSTRTVTPTSPPAVSTQAAPSNSIYSTTVGAGGSILPCVNISPDTITTTIGSTNSKAYQAASKAFDIHQDSAGTWHISVHTKNKKFIRGILQTFLNDCDELDLEESLEVTKQINKVI